MSGIADAPLGCVPILWNNVDLVDLAPEVAGTTVMDEIARLGFGNDGFASR